MKIAKVFVILIVVGFVAVHSKSLVAPAIKTIIKEYFVKESPKFELIFHCQNGSTNELVDELLQFKDQSVAYKVLKTFVGDSWTNPLNFPSLIIFNSVETFKATKNIPWLSQRGEHRNHFVHIPNATTSDIIEHGQNGFPMQAVNFLMNETKESIDLVSFRVVRHKTCGVCQFKKINQFNRKSMKWKSRSFYLKEFLDFPNCTLIVDRVCRDCLTYDGKIFRELFDSLKYKSKIGKVPSSNLTINDFDVCLYRSCVGDSFFLQSFVLLIREVIVTVPAGDPYTQLEKMFLMFDIEVWTAIVVTLLTALASIQVMNLMSIKIRNFLFGRNIKTPTVNLAATFLAGGQFKVPQRNFARFILMLFIIWSLIIRTCYQSLLYTSLQADSRKPRIRTKDELFEANLTYLEVPGRFKKILFGDRNESFKTDTCHGDTFQCLEIAAEPANRATTVILSTMISKLNSEYRSGFSSIYALEEAVDYYQNVFYFPLSSPFIERFNEKIHDLHTSGLIKFWEANFLNPKGFIQKPEDIGPQVLTMEHLEVCFLICLLPLLLGLIAFIGEIGFARWKLRSARRE